MLCYFCFTIIHHQNRLAFSILHIERTKGKNWRKRVAVKISFSWEVKYNVSFFKTNFFKLLYFLVHLISSLKPNNPCKKNERINFLCFYWPPSNDNHCYYFFCLCFRLYFVWIIVLSTIIISICSFLFLTNDNQYNYLLCFCFWLLTVFLPSELLYLLQSIYLIFALFLFLFLTFDNFLSSELYLWQSLQLFALFMFLFLTFDNFSFVRVIVIDSVTNWATFVEHASGFAFHFHFHWRKMNRFNNLVKSKFTSYN